MVLLMQREPSAAPGDRNYESGEDEGLHSCSPSEPGIAPGTLARLRRVAVCGGADTPRSHGYSPTCWLGAARNASGRAVRGSALALLVSCQRIPA